MIQVYDEFSELAHATACPCLHILLKQQTLYSISRRHRLLSVTAESSSDHEDPPENGLV